MLNEPVSEILKEYFIPDLTNIILEYLKTDIIVNKSKEIIALKCKYENEIKKTESVVIEDIKEILLKHLPIFHFSKTPVPISKDFIILLKMLFEHYLKEGEWMIYNDSMPIDLDNFTFEGSEKGLNVSFRNYLTFTNNRSDIELMLDTLKDSFCFDWRYCRHNFEWEDNRPYEEFIYLPHKRY